MKRIAIQDANIIIDLIHIDLFSLSLDLEFRFFTTDIIHFELNDHQSSIIQDYVHLGKFGIISISKSELEEIKSLSTVHKKLSEQDCSALYFAEKHKAVLLSGDKHLRKAAEFFKIEVRGILWIFDQLIEKKIIEKTTALVFLEKLLLINKRLPMDQCKKRMEAWGE